MRKAGISLIILTTLFALLISNAHANTIWGWQMDNHKTDQSMTFSNGTQGVINPTAPNLTTSSSRQPPIVVMQAGGGDIPKEIITIDDGMSFFGSGPSQYLTRTYELTTLNDFASANLFFTVLINGHYICDGQLFVKLWKSDSKIQYFYTSTPAYCTYSNGYSVRANISSRSSQLNSGYKDINALNEGDVIVGLTTLFNQYAAQISSNIQNIEIKYEDGKIIFYINYYRSQGSNSSSSGSVDFKVRCLLY
ncbi:MAG: hypothetical protein GY729_17495 [Desulfobacteraceae bacterium]|nr:hypothetical protein [Desulfobacteraceae bacterium]